MRYSIQTIMKNSNGVFVRFKGLSFVLSVLFFLIFLPVGVAFASSGGGEGGATSTSMGHMMTNLVLQLAIIVIAARVLGIIFERYLKQPKVLGELVAGMLIGPYALGSLHIPFLGKPLFEIPAHALPVNPELYGFAVLASIILLFVSGLETDLPTFMRFSLVGTTVGLGGVILSFTCGDLIAVALIPNINSFMDPTALFLGTLSTATSVGITARILSEKRKMSSPEGVTILAAAVLDDVIGIILLAVVVGIVKVETSGGNVEWVHIGFITLKAFSFWIVFTVVGIFIAPRITKGLKWFQNMDAVAGAAFGLALFLAGLSEVAGLAMIIGAYIMGLSLSQTDIAHELQEHLSGLYNFFVPIFFCVMGMMVNFAAVLNIFFFGLIFSVVAVIAKMVGCSIPALLNGFTPRGALRVSAGMLPRGEVTLIVAGIGLSSGAIGQDMFGVAIMTLLLASIIAPPLLIKSFEGGSGYREDVKKETSHPLEQISLDFPNTYVADFMRNRILQTFRSEEFFVNRLDFNNQIYQIRKEDILITFTQEGTHIMLNMSPENQQLVRLILLEQILDLKEVLNGIQEMQSTDTMGADLLSGMFE